MAFDLARRVRLAVLIAALGSLAGEDSMAGDQPMEETLVIRVVQMGFAGETGTEYRVEPNGVWQARRFVNERTTEELGQGTLSSGAMIELAHQVEAAQLEEAQQTDMTDQVNAAFVELRLGNERAVAPLGEGASLAGDCPAAAGSSRECAYLDLARSVEAKTQQ